MAVTKNIPVTGGDLQAGIKDFLTKVLEQDDIGAVLAPRRLPMKEMVMPALLNDPEALDGVDPLAPAFPMNAAKIAAKLSRKPAGAKLACVLRPCEIRAMVELVKLKQAKLDDLLIIGVDCLGAYQNTDYFQMAGDDPAAFTEKFVQSVLAGSPPEGAELASACKVCELMAPDGADIAVGLFGVNTQKGLPVIGQTEKGEAFLESLELSNGGDAESRQQAVDLLARERTEQRDQMFTETREIADNLEKLGAYFAHCVNCYNCRVACPVCYCKECVFLTDVFDHEPAQYLQWSRQKGAVKMPTDTLFFHLTRLTHMSTACVGCGQCSNACPNDIPVMEIFRTVADKTQAAFDYQAGKNVEDDPPLSVFREDEFPEVVGMN